MVGSTSLISSVRRMARAFPGSAIPSTRSLLRSDSTNSVAGTTPRSEVISVSSNSSQVSSSIRSRVISSSRPRLNGLFDPASRRRRRTRRLSGASGRSRTGASGASSTSGSSTSGGGAARTSTCVAEGSFPASSAGFSQPRGAGSMLGGRSPVRSARRRPTARKPTTATATSKMTPTTTHRVVASTGSS